MKFLKVSDTPEGHSLLERADAEGGRPISANGELMFARYIRADAFIEFRITENGFTGDDRYYFVGGFLPGEKYFAPYGNIIESFDTLPEAEKYLDELVAGLNGEQDEDSEIK